MNRRNRVVSYILCVFLIGGMYTFAPKAFAEEGGAPAASQTSAVELTQNEDSSGQEDQEAVLPVSSDLLTLPSVDSAPSAQAQDETEDKGQTSDDGENTEEPEPAVYKIKVTQTAGGTVSAPSTVTEKQAKEGVTVTVTPDKGYGISSFLINGKTAGDNAKGPEASGDSYLWTIYPTGNTTVKAKFHKSASYVFIMLDAGHYGKVNQSPVLKSYYESNMTWALHLYLKQELEEYKNVVVDTTRASQKKDLEIYSRGTASKGYDLFLSLHSNAISSKTPDYPLVITQKGNTKDALAVSLAQTIQSVMNTKQDYQIWQKLNRDGKTEYYGVLRGSKAVGTKGMILEHSFHTNLAAAKWLSKDSNLKKLAEAEAADIAAYYGLRKTGNDMITPSKPSVSVSSASYNSATLKWKKSIGATGYIIYRASSKKGAYKKIKTITKGTTLTYKNTKLKTGKTYYYKVRPFRKVGNTIRYGADSAIKSCKARPAKPSVSSSAGKRKITIRWKKVTGASGYVVYRATKKSGSYKKIASLKSSRRSYTNTGLKKGKRYYYKARAYRKVSGKKVYSLYSGYTSKVAK